MVKEYHNQFLHVVIDCKTGNEAMDKGVESSIAGYIHLVLYALGTGKMGILSEKMEGISQEFVEQAANENSNG